jgi:Fungalysin/Thermolysin Propeptide Motif
MFAGAVLAGTSEQIVYAENQTPAWIVSADDVDYLFPRVNADPKTEALLALQKYSQAFRFGPDDGFVVTALAPVRDVRGIGVYDGDAVVNAQSFSAGITLVSPAENQNAQTVWMQQTFKGMPVSGGVLAVAMNDKGVQSVHGKFYSGIVVGGMDQLSSDQLLAKARLGLLAQLPGSKLTLRWVSQSPQIRVDEAGKAHHVRIALADYDGSQGNEKDNLLIDTADGSIVARLPNVLRAQQTLLDWQSPVTGAARCVGAPAGNPLGVPEDNNPLPTASYVSPAPYLLAFLDPAGQLSAAHNNAAAADSFYTRLFDWHLITEIPR